MLPNHKKDVCNLIALDPCSAASYYQSIEVSEVWGIGRQHVKKLNSMGIHSVLDLVRTNPNSMKEVFSVVIARTITELQGISCIEVEYAPLHHHYPEGESRVHLKANIKNWFVFLY